MVLTCCRKAARGGITVAGRDFRRMWMEYPGRPLNPGEGALMLSQGPQETEQGEKLNAHLSTPMPSPK